MKNISTNFWLGEAIIEEVKTVSIDATYTNNNFNSPFCITSGISDVRNMWKIIADSIIKRPQDMDQKNLENLDV